jgi:hypothetical protein
MVHNRPARSESRRQDRDRLVGCATRRFIDGAAGRLAQHSIAQTLCHSRKHVADSYRPPPATARRRNPPSIQGFGKGRRGRVTIRVALYGFRCGLSGINGAAAADRRRPATAIIAAMLSGRYLVIGDRSAPCATETINIVSSLCARSHNDQRVRIRDVIIT